MYYLSRGALATLHVDFIFMMHCFAQYRVYKQPLARGVQGKSRLIDYHTI